MVQWLPIAFGYIVASLGLIAEHVALWRQPWRLDAPWNYIIGVLTILCGCGVWAMAVRGPIQPDEAWIAFALIAAGSGAWVALAYYVRDRQARARNAAIRRGEVVGGARGLISELLEGDADATHDPRRHN